MINSATYLRDVSDQQVFSELLTSSNDSCGFLFSDGSAKYSASEGYVITSTTLTNITHRTELLDLLSSL